MNNIYTFKDYGITQVQVKSGRLKKSMIPRDYSCEHNEFQFLCVYTILCIDDGEQIINKLRQISVI
jgi:hypothetical protein